MSDNIVVILVLVTHWTDDYWYKSGEAPYSMSFESRVRELPRQRYRAVGLYWKGKLRGEFVDRTQQNPAFLFVDDIRSVDEGITLSYEYAGRINLTSLSFAERIRRINRYVDGFPLCFVLEDDEWKEIEMELNVVTPDQWRLHMEAPLNWLGDYFKIETYDWEAYERVVAACFNILGFRVKRLGALKRDEEARVPDGYLYTPPTTSKQSSFWVAYDCKARFNFPEKGDRPADEERKMIEYIQNEERRTHVMGVEPNNKYFLYVAHSFKPYAAEMSNRIHNATRAVGGLMTTRILRYLVEKRLRTGYKFIVENISRLFANREISFSDIDAVFPREDEFG